MFVSYVNKTKGGRKEVTYCQGVDRMQATGDCHESEKSESIGHFAETDWGKNMTWSQMASHTTCHA